MVTITEWGFGTDNTLAKARVDAFNRRYASSIKLNVVPQVNAQKILTAVASGNVPDILWLDRASIASWAARGALEPLDDLIGKSRVVRMSQFYPAAVKQVTYSGHVWGVPQFMDVRPLWVNLDPLKQAGLTPAQVQHASWNALRADGIKLTKKRGSKVSRWGFDTKVQDGFFWMYSWGNGGDLLSADGKHASFDDAKNVAALQYVVETVKSQGGLAALKAFAETWGWNAQHPFIQNQVGITLYENWLLGMIAQFAPSHNFAVYPFHGMNGKPVSLTGGLAWAIPKGAANRDAAWTFIEFMTAASTWKIGAQADKAQNGAKGAPFIPYLIANTVVDKMLMTDEYKPISAKFDQVVRLFPYLLQHGRSIPASPVYNQLNDITIIYTALYVPLHMVVALGLALLLNTRVRGIPFWRTFFYLPSITPIVAVAILWRWILNPSGGAINAVLAWIGISGPAWTTDPLWMKPSLVLIALWAVGSTMLIYVAGLKNVPQELYEAAKVDGAGVFRRFFSVTLPMLSSVLFFTAVIGVVNALQIFTQAVVLFQPLGGGGDTASAMSGGTGSAALFYIMYLFSQAFAYFKMGYASALAWILFVIIVAFTIVQFRLSNRWVYYEGGEA